MSWLWRGAQSAIFYYLSCTPWFVYVNERKREKERSRAKAAKSSEETDDGQYAHPLASDTNPYWQEEMMLGPVLKRGQPSKDKKSESAKRLNTAGENSSAGDNSVVMFPSLELEGATEVDLTWSKKRYQRPDEYLWGSDDPSCSPYVSLNSRAANKPLVSGDGAYYNAQNPAVRELHPPIISSKPKHPSQALWMIQPPPSAKLMAGKEREDRSRSVSNSSYASGSGTGGALAGRYASLRKSPAHLELPEDMDPLPPEDDGEHPNGSYNGKPPIPNTNTRTRLHPNDIPSFEQSNGRPKTSIAVRRSHTNEFKSNRLSLKSFEPLTRTKSASPTTPLQTLQDVGPDRVSPDIRNSSGLENAANGKLPLPRDLEDKASVPGFPFGEAIKDDYIPAQRWSMDI